MPAIPFLSAPWLDQKMASEAQKCGLWQVNAPLDIEAFLERYLGVDLDLDATLGEEILGEVVFRRGKKTCVGINALLVGERDRAVNEGGAQSLAATGRFRMTLAHEAAHVILHGPLWEREDDGATIHRCYKRADKTFSEADFALESAEIAAFYGERAQIWVRQAQDRARMEWQANRGAAALLMPLSYFRAATKELFQNARQLAPAFSDAQHREWVEGQLAARFAVSLQAAKIRMKALNL